MIPLNLCSNKQTMNITQKEFANVVLILAVLAIIGVAGYFVVVKKSKPIQERASTGNSKLLPPPTLAFTSITNPYLSITVDSQCGRDYNKNYNLYRSTDNINWTKLLSINYKTAFVGPDDREERYRYGCSPGHPMDKNLPKDATKLYYKYSLLDSNGQEVEWSEIAIADIGVINKFRNNILPSRVTTSDWKTYTNDKYGFEIQLPNDWQSEVPPYIHADFTVVFNSQKNLVYKAEAEKEVVGHGVPDNIIISYYDDISKMISGNGLSKAPNSLLEEYLKKISKHDFYNLKKINFVGQEAFRGSGIGLFDEDIIWIQRDKHLYVLSVYDYSTSDILPYQILSTLKFTK